MTSTAGRTAAVKTMSRRLVVFVALVTVAGAGLIGQSLAVIRHVPVDIYLILLVGLTIASGRFHIKVPGRPATVSVSEIFVFTLALLFGPAAATLTIAADGAWASFTQTHRRLYRAIFNVAEPAIATWTATHVFFAIAGTGSLMHSSAASPTLVLATIAMAAVFFVLNSGLTALALALESGASPYEVWRRHAWYLAVNYYAAASLAALAVGHGSPIDPNVVGLVAPLLILSYVAYREASTRVDEAHRHVRELEHQYQAAVEMLAIAVDAKDQVTHGHIRRVQRYTRAVAEALGVSDTAELKAIEAGALLHDIGKLGVPDYVLNKPSALNRAEFETMKKHVTMGVRILNAVDFPYPVVPIVRHHHEQWNGRGYPDGLVGVEIPLGARILAVVDCFDALTSDRPYRPRVNEEQAIEILRARKESFYDPTIVDTLVALLPALLRNDADLDSASSSRCSVIAGLRGADGRTRRLNREILESTSPVRRRVRTQIDEQIARITGADACLFAVVPGDDMLCVAHATAGLRDAVTQFQLPLGGGVSGWVAANRTTIRNVDPELDFGEMAVRLAVTSCTCMPVFVRGELFGVLSVYLARTGELSENELRVVGTLTQELGLLLDGAEADADDDAPVVSRRGQGPVAVAS